MHSSVGLAIIVFSGMLIASFAAPMKLARAWSWENTWLIYATLALLVIPPRQNEASAPQTHLQVPSRFSSQHSS